MQCKLLNSFEWDESTDTTLPAGKGIGLQNVRKRLELLYPGRYQFSAMASKEVFIVNLDLQWEENTEPVIKNNIVKPAYATEMPVGG